MAPILRFELARVVRTPSLWVLCALFFLIAAYAGAQSDPSFGLAVSTTVNAPANVAALIGIASAAAMFGWGALFARSVVFDTGSAFSTVFFSLPFRNLEYVVGKTLAAVVGFMLPCCAAALGLWCGTQWAPVGQQEWAPATFAPYAYGLFALALPNAWFAAAVIFATASRSRSVGSTYFGLIVLFLLHALAALTLTSSNPHLGQLLDPFGIRSFTAVNANDTILDDKAWVLTVLDPGFLTNRLLWLSVSTLLLGLAGRWVRSPYTVHAKEALARESQPRSTRAPAPASPSPSWWSQMRAIAGFHFALAVRSPTYLIALAVGAVLIVMNTATVPGIPTAVLVLTTKDVADVFIGTFSTILAVVLIVMAVEMVFHDESNGSEGLWDAMPIHAGVTMVGKGVALLGLVLVFEATGLLVCAAVLSLGSPLLFDPAALWAPALVALTFPLLSAAGAVAVLTGTRSRHVGVAVIGAVVATRLIAQASGTPSHALAFGWLPAMIHSDITGYGSQVQEWGLYAWSWAAVVGLALVAAPWVRSASSPLRWAMGGVLALTALAATLVLHGIGSDPDPQTGLTARQAAQYETTYGDRRGADELTVVDIRTAIDLDASRRTARAAIHYQLTNESAHSIDAIRLDWNPLMSVTIASGTSAIDPALGTATVRLSSPVPPGGRADLDLTSTLSAHAFDHTAAGLLEKTAAVVRSELLLPTIGYNAGKELRGANQRERFGLPRAPTARPSSSVPDNLLSSHFARSRLDTRVTVDGDLLALAPGTLVEQRKEAARSQYHYVTPEPVLPYFAVVAGQWVKDTSRSDQTQLDLYYHAGHEGNVPAIRDAARAALTYGTAHVGALGVNTLRVIEVPRQIGNPQSFPGMMILPESVGFLFDPQSASHDWTTMIVAHEAAHQWWALNVIPAAGPGAQVISESMAQYTAFRVLQQKHRSDAAWFVDNARADYLAGRRRHVGDELALVETDGDPYLTYGKGAVVIEAIAKAMGEHRADEFFSTFLRTYAHDYPTARDLEQALLDRAGEGERARIREGFEGTGLPSAMTPDPKRTHP